MKRDTAPAYFQHQVRHSGETFSTIALWYTGAAYNWRKLEASNAHLRERRLRLGDTINIPEDLLRRRSPLPASFVSQRSFERRASVPAIDEEHESEAARPSEESTVSELMEPPPVPTPQLTEPPPEEPSVFFGSQNGTDASTDKDLEEQQKNELLENLLK